MTSQPSQYDRDHIAQILRGHGSWYSAALIRLIAAADSENRELLRIVYPAHVRAYEEWHSGEHPSLDFEAAGPYSPGVPAPASGIYRPTGGGTEVALSKDDRFPSLDPQKGGWLLVDETDRPLEPTE